MDISVKGEKYKNLILIRAEISILESGVPHFELVDDMLFYCWRKEGNACSCYLITIIGGTRFLLTGERRVVILGVLPSVLSKSFTVGEKLFWGGLGHPMGELLIEEFLNNIPYQDERKYITLFRPVNQSELDLIAQLNWEQFPPRLPSQPFFYPVLNERYADQISKDWNVPAYGVGYVVMFKLNKEYFDLLSIRNVGDAHHNELWVPAEELSLFNDSIIGKIEIVSRFD